MSEDSLKVAEFMKQKQLFVPDGHLPASARPIAGGTQDPMSPIFFNYDDCIIQGRDTAGNLVADKQAFPYGMLNVSHRLNQMGF